MKACAWKLLVIASLCLACQCTLASPELAPTLAALGVKSGLAVHLGTSDGALECDLAARGMMLVHGLALDENSLAKARAAIRFRRLYGLASVAHRESLRSLPYGDNLVNLLVADLDRLQGNAPSEPELLRVLVPSGVACLKRGGQWSLLRKPWPAGLDDWTHYDHGPDGNAVSRDQRVGPATTAKWLDGYRWIGYAHRESSGFRSDRGRLVHEFRFEKHSSYLVGRDAFNGLACWSTNRHAAEDGLPMTLHKGLLYTHLSAAAGQPAPLVALDATSGQWVRTFAHATPVTEFKRGREAFKRVRILALNDTIIHVNGETMVALEPETGALKWKLTEARPLLFAVASADENKIFAVLQSEGARSHWTRWPGSDVAAILCVDAASGKELWRNTDLAGSAIGQLVCAEGRLLFLAPIGIGAFGHDERTERPQVGVLRTRDGQLLWSRNYRDDHPKGNWPGFLFASVIRDHTAFLMNQNRFLPYDLANGAPGPAFDPASVNNRCVRPRATEEYFLIGFGLYVDRAGRWTFQNIGRSDCATGLLPANGMTYQTPNDCHCFAQLRGFAGFASELLPPAVPDEQRLEHMASKPDSVRTATVELPAAETVSVGNSLRKIPPLRVRVPQHSASLIRDSWSNNDTLPSPCSDAVNVGDRDYVAIVNEHRLEVRQGGQVLWAFTAEARISHPPVVRDGRVFVAAHDGYVYGLNEADGALRWRFLAAPAQRWMVAYGQLESVAPVFNVVWHNGDLCCCAGRHPELDGGLTLWRLDPATGQSRSKKTLHRALEWAAARDKTFSGLQNYLVNDPLRVSDGKLLLFGHDVDTLQSPTRLYKDSCPIEPYVRIDKVNGLSR